MKTTRWVLSAVIVLAGVAALALPRYWSVEPFDMTGKIKAHKITGDSPDDIIYHFTGATDAIE